RDGQLRRTLQDPDVAGKLHGERVETDSAHHAAGAGLAGEAPAGEKGPAPAHARAGEPRERVERPAPRRRGAREPERAVGEGVERRLERKRGRGPPSSPRPGVPLEAGAAGGELPAVPRHAVE